jgi:hypothetical protein
MTKFIIRFCKLMLFHSFMNVSSNLFGSMLVLDDVGLPKAFLPTDLVPSNSTPYLGSILEIL